MKHLRSDFDPITMTRLPKTDWEQPRQQSEILREPCNVETPMSKNALFGIGNLVVSESMDDDLIKALHNEAAWTAFIEAVPLAVKDKNLNS